MLIHIDRSIVDVGDDLSRNLIDSLEDVASIVRAGTHLVVGDILALKFLVGLDSLGVSARHAFRSLAGKHAQFAAARQLVSTYAEVVAYGDKPSLIRRDGVDVIVIPLHCVAGLNLRGPTEIIYEEIQDDYIYEIISRWYVRSKITPGFLNRNYRAVHGGGGRTHAVYSEAQRRNDQFCLCVTDSDQKFPADTPGSTSTEVRGVNDVAKALSYHLDLDFHEVENLVPLSFLKEKCSSPTSQGIAEKIKNTDFAGYPEAKLYWDYKKGFSLAALKGLDGGWEYWKAALQLPDLNCGNACVPKCQCEILKPWPEKRVVKDHIQAFAQMEPSGCEVLAALWDKIGCSLISWSISAVPKST